MRIAIVNVKLEDKPKLTNKQYVTNRRNMIITFKDDRTILTLLNVKKTLVFDNSDSRNAIKI